MKLKVQTATTGEEYWDLTGWDITDEMFSFTSTVMEI